jgi:hypothetical protein
LGDLILSRRNDTTIDIRDALDNAKSVSPIRNGNRWRVAAIDAATNRVAAERLGDGARVVFGGDYLREHISLGYAVTVHSAQGVTADTCHAVLSESCSRPLLYVAMTRGRCTNTAHIYERVLEAHGVDREQLGGMHIAYRGDRGHAADLVRAILANDDHAVITAHDYAAQRTTAALPGRARSLLSQRATKLRARAAAYQTWQAQSLADPASTGNARYAHRSHARDHSFEL